jgi:lipopolysaccharide/colanic/teichoic acid biosynthesis glycosyltransferase
VPTRAARGFRSMHFERAIDSAAVLPLGGNTGWAVPSRATIAHEYSWYPFCRGMAEFVASLILLVVTAPVVLLAAAAVRLTSRGPAVYAQKRLGRGGRVYTMYKLRSMYHECERQSGICWSRPGDPRITPVGRFLRFTHIDELPQLWNVLKGEMSLIGPRPERPELVARLARDIPRYRERMQVRPGVTGFAQVQLPYDSGLESVRRKLAYDLYYIEAVSFGLDLRILLGTVLKMSGIPFSVIGWLFVMPSVSEVEAAYRSAAPRRLTALTQPQPA